MAEENKHPEEAKEVALNEKLAEVLDKFGDTPIEEPELYKALDAKPLKKAAVVRLALADSGHKINDFTAMENALFFRKLSQKILSVKNEDGSFKSTPLTQECDLPDFEQAEEIHELWLEAIEAKDPAEKAMLFEKRDALAWEVSGLKKSKLSEWEQMLVVEQILQCGYDVTMTSLGRELKN